MTLAWDSSGAGPPVLLVHSTVCDRRMWDRQMPALAGAGYRAVRCDLPDFQEIAADLAGRLPSAEHVRLAWAGHLPSLESPERFNPILLGFLRQHAAAAPA